MKLNSKTVKVQDKIAGSIAAIVKDDINGSILVVQILDSQVHVKISDLINFLAEQNKKEEPKSE